ncbi:hypothetical protein Hte_007820 [Hypoxylon texense]
MQLTTILFLAALAATAAHADCFPENGIDAAWWYKADARAQAQKACNDGGPLAGKYTASGTDGARKQACVAAAPPPPAYGGRRQHYVFEVTHIGGSGDRTITAAECYDGLRKEITGCDYGGVREYSNWRYKSDPNPGTCP